MKSLKKFTSEILVLILVITTFTIGFTAFSENKYENGDVIKFGSYPQTKVTDEDLISALDESVTSDDFVSFGYYSGTGTIGTEKAGDFMLYTDTVYHGEKYRGIIINEKRPNYSYNATGSYKQTQIGYSVGITYWFKYDPIEWIVIDADNGLVISRYALDAQPFNNSSLTADESGNNSVYTSSSLKDFINNSLFRTAFGNDVSMFNKIRDNYLFIPTESDIIETAGWGNTTENTVTSDAYTSCTDYGYANGVRSDSLNGIYYSPYWLDSVDTDTFENAVYLTASLPTFKVYQTIGVRVEAYINLNEAADTYALTYNDNGNITTEYLHEGDIIENNTPVREHYTFLGWDCEIPGTMPDHDLTVNAEWQINTNKLTLNANGGIFSDGSDEKEFNVNYGENLINYIEIPSKQGFVFVDWDDSETVTMPDNELTLNAVWKEADDTPYTINVYKEKATGSNNDKTEYDLEVINLKGTTNSSAEYTPEELEYFDFDEDNSNTNAVIKADGSTVMNVYYTRKTGIVRFVIGAGYPSVNTVYKYGQKITYPEIPARDGYAGSWDNVSETFDGTIDTFNVIWTAGEYSITFDTDGGSNINSIVAECDSPITAPEDPVKEGYKFIGWDKEFPETMPAGGLQLKAIWEKKTYNIYYVVDDITTITVPVLYDETIPSQESPVAEGKTFTGWSSKLPEKMPANDLTVYALFDSNEYTIRWNYDDKYEYTKVKYGDKIVPFDNPVKTGYSFAGWDKEIPETMPADDLEFNAEFEICSYKITFIANGETVADYTINYGDPIKAPAAPEITGYTFAEWKSLPETMPAYNVESNAVYSKNSYKLTYFYGDKTKTYNVGYLEGLPVPEDLDITGYTFKGWNEPVPKSMPAYDLTFTANYELTPVISISGCRNRTEKYKVTITFYAEYSGCSSNEIVWYDGNGNVIGTGESVTVKQANKSYNVTAKIVKDSNVIASSETEKVTIKTGFFDKIISFFGRLFVPSKYIIDQR